MGTKGFLEGAKVTKNLAGNFLRAARSSAGVGGSAKRAARAAANAALYGEATIRAGSETLGGLGGSWVVGYHDTYFTPATAKNALEVLVGFIPVVGTAYAGWDLMQCLIEQ
jgi:hypothetical protein